MAYLGTQPNDVKKNIGLYTPNKILRLTKDGNWGGSFELIEENIISSDVSSVNFTNIMGDRYDVHALEIRGLETNGGGSFLVQIRVSTDGGSSYISTTSYQNAQFVLASAGSTSELRSNTDTGINMGYCNDTEQNSTIAYFYDFSNADKYSWSSFMSMKQGLDCNVGGGMYNAVAAVNAIQVRGGTFDTGVIRLYGLKQTT